MNTLIALLASVLVIDVTAPDAGTAAVSLRDTHPATEGFESLPALLKGKGPDRTLDFCVGAATNGVDRNFFTRREDGLYRASVPLYRKLLLSDEAVDPCLFLRDTQRTFGALYLASRFCRVNALGPSAVSRVLVAPDADTFVNIAGDGPADWDVLLEGRSIAGDDVAWKELLHIVFDEGFGARYPENFLRVLGRNATGTTNLDYPVLIDTRSLMVCALICDFMGLQPEIYAVRARLQPWMDRTGFRFLIGERLSSGGASLPLEIHRRLLENAEYCRGYADVVHEACVRTNGEMAVESCARRMKRRIAEYRETCGDAVDSAAGVASLEAEKANILARARAFRPAGALAKLLSVKAPLALAADGTALPAYGRYRGRVSLAVPPGAGTVYFSENGCDPREEGGAVSPLCRVYREPFEVQGRCRLRARTRTDDGAWSALEMVNLNM